MSSVLRHFPLSLRVLLAASAGSLCVLSYAPFSIFPLALVALAVFYGLVAGQTLRGAFLTGWGFGIGLLAFGIFWIRISLNEYGNMAPWLAHLLTIFFVLGMALYYGIAGALSAWLSCGPRWSGPLLAFPAAWVLTEWLRSWLFTGFPWLTIGHSQIDSFLSGYAPIVGVYGVGLVVALCAGLLWGLVRWPGRARYAALGGLVMIWLSGAVLTRIEWTEPNGEPFSATVVQANIQQSLKWNPDARISILGAYLELTRANWDSDLIVWPETAVPDFLHQVRNAFVKPLAEEAREQGAELVIGIPVMDLEARTYFNGLISVGTSEDVYRKRHLVPFGEFIPFRDWLGPIADAFEVPMSDFSSGDAPRPLLAGRHSIGRGVHLLRGHLCRRGTGGPSGRGLSDQREQRCLVRRLPGTPSAPGDGAYAGPGERALAGAVHQHRDLRHPGPPGGCDRGRASLRAGCIHGTGAAARGSDALRALGKLVRDRRRFCDAGRRLSALSPSGYGRAADFGWLPDATMMRP